MPEVVSHFTLVASLLQLLPFSGHGPARLRPRGLHEKVLPSSPSAMTGQAEFSLQPSALLNRLAERRPGTATQRVELLRTLKAIYLEQIVFPLDL